MRSRFSLLLILALTALPAHATRLERPLPSSGEVGIPDVVTLAAGEAIPASPAPSPLAGVFAQFVTPQGLASIVVTVLGLVGGALGLTALRKRQIAIVTSAAFHGVEDLAATTENTVDDKIAAGLKIADEWMAAQGWRPLKPGEQEVVKLGFKAINGASALQEKVQANALEAAVPAGLITDEMVAKSRADMKAKDAALGPPSAS